MLNENDVTVQLLRAKEDVRSADDLIKQYFPFIKAETAKYMGVSITGSEDEFSVALYAFYEAIMAYEKDRGSFFALASKSIRNRLIDYSRKEDRHSSTKSMQEEIGEGDGHTIEEVLADDKDQIDSFHQREATKLEIDEYTANLKECGLSLTDIADNCPKQDKTFQSCMKVVEAVMDNSSILDYLILTKKLPIQKLSDESGVSRKLLDRYRKYLVGILLAYTNGFEIIRGHLTYMKMEVCK